MVSCVLLRTLLLFVGGHSLELGLELEVFVGNTPIKLMFGAYPPNSYGALAQSFVSMHPTLEVGGGCGNRECVVAKLASTMCEIAGGEPAGAGGGCALLTAEPTPPPVKPLETPIYELVCARNAYRPRGSRRYPPSGPPPEPDLLMDAPKWGPAGVDWFTLLSAQRLLEIGGPTEYWPHYSKFQEIYIVDTPEASVFDSAETLGPESPENTTTARANLADGTVISWKPIGLNSSVGTLLRRAGDDLSGILDGVFDVVFSAHCLEHFVDPLRALLEWTRVLKPGGLLFLIVPAAPYTMDKNRSPSTSQHLFHLHAARLSDQRRTRESGPGRARKGRTASESMPPHHEVDRVQGDVLDEYMRQSIEQHARLYPEYIEGAPWPHSAINGTAKTWEERRQAVLKQVLTEEETTCRSPEPGNCTPSTKITEFKWHWHVWDFDLLHEIVGDCLGFEILLMDFMEPYHNILVARKPLT